MKFLAPAEQLCIRTPLIKLCSNLCVLLASDQYDSEPNPDWISGKKNCYKSIASNFPLWSKKFQKAKNLEYNAILRRTTPQLQLYALLMELEKNMLLFQWWITHSGSTLLANLPYECHQKSNFETTCISRRSKFVVVLQHSTLQHWQKILKTISNP